MLTLQDCVGIAGLTPNEVGVIAEHDQVPEIVAAEIGNALLTTPQGTYTLRRYILEMLERAAEHRQLDREKHLRDVLTVFNAAHPVPRVL